VRFNERIVLAGEEITDGALANVLRRVIAANAGAPLTFFEATTAAAYLAFSETPADLAIIEVGLGGRFDATNVITPALSLITPIDYDHAEFLGRDLSKIAREKAGIMKRHMPVISGPQSDLVNAVLRSEAQKIGAAHTAWGEQYRAYEQHGRMVFEDDDQLMDLPLPALVGAHQIQNAGLAVAAAKLLQCDSDAIEKGLSQASWPARMQRLTGGPLAKTAHASGAELWLDGGHNPHAAKVIASVMADQEARSSRPLILVMGILANKDAGGFLDQFEGLASALIAVNIEGHSALSPDTLCELARARGIKADVSEDITEAVQRAARMGQSDSQEFDGDSPAPRILICGSLYLAGQVLGLKD
jgi:dihydrofolate synthase/folylpolyglutamate synthase